MQVLEALQQMEHGVTGKQYDFPVWRHCTAGHIYTATHGRTARNDSVILRGALEKGLAKQVADVLITASLPLLKPARRAEMESLVIGEYMAHEVISYMTSGLASQERITRRDAATRMVRAAIKKIEAEQEHARLSLLQRAREKFAFNPDNAKINIDIVQPVAKGREVTSLTVDDIVAATAVEAEQEELATV